MSCIRYSDISGLIPKIDESGKTDANEQPDEGQGSNDGTPVSVLLKDDGEDLESQIQKCVDKRGVEGYAGNHGFSYQHSKWPCKVLRDYRLWRQFYSLGRMIECFVPSLFAQLLCLFLEENWRIDLR